jgi:CubicO group peptidase (beta-lactamase class C family)
MVKKIVSLVVFLWVAVSFVVPPAYGKYIEVAAESNVNEIGRYMERMMKGVNLPGAVAVIVQEEREPVIICRGYSDVAARSPVTEETLFELGSNCKTFTSLGILLLENQGLIDMKKSVKAYIPWFDVKYKDKMLDITVEDLFYHTSGVDNGSIDLLRPSDADTALEDVTRKIVEHGAVWTSGDLFQYSSGNYDVLGLLIEIVSEMPFEQFMEENILTLYELNNTVFGRENAIKHSDMSVGYKVDLFGNRAYDAPVYRGNTPAGYVSMNGYDMVKWLSLQLAAARKSPGNDELIRKSQRPDNRVWPTYTEPYDKAFQYAGGWLVFEDGMISHGGNNPNYSSYILIYAKYNYAIGILVNRNTSYAYGMAKSISDIMQGKGAGDIPPDIPYDLAIITRVVLTGLFIFYVVMSVCIIDAIRRIKRNQSEKLSHRPVWHGSIIFAAIIAIFLVLVKLIFWWFSWHFILVWSPLPLLYLIASVIIASGLLITRLVLKKLEGVIMVNE